MTNKDSDNGDDNPEVLSDMLVFVVSINVIFVFHTCFLCGVIVVTLKTLG